MIREVRRERILDNRNKALKVQEKQAAMMEKVISITEMIMKLVMFIGMMMKAAMMEKVIMMIAFNIFKIRDIAAAAKFAK